MKLLTFSFKDEKQKVGIQVNDSIFSLGSLVSLFNEANSEQVVLPDDLQVIIFNNERFLPVIRKIWEWAQEEKRIAEESAYSLGEVRIEAPIKSPGKVVCVGNNYMDHCIEQNVKPPAKPMIFSKWSSCIIGNNDEIILPQDSKQVDYEAELAVVIGKNGRNIAENEAFDYIFGYTIMNDVSARDVQFEDVQWVRGKSFDTFAPLGPAIVTKDDIHDPHHLDIKLKINDRVLQDSNTKHLIFDIPYIISYLSKGFTFEPGDIIATGTPHGVGVFREPQVFLQSGDTCQIEVESIGILKNSVR